MKEVTDEACAPIREALTPSGDIYPVAAKYSSGSTRSIAPMRTQALGTVGIPHISRAHLPPRLQHPSTAHD
jgi:hypothetical protein